MPNHITNIVEASPVVISSMKLDGVIDFSSVIHKPSCLDEFNPHTGIINRAKAALGLFVKGHDFLERLELDNAVTTITTPIPENEIQLVIQALNNYAETGSVYWHDWCTENWGTKWNAYSQEDDRNSDTVAAFETAWSMPNKVAKALSKKHPEEVITWKFADEDLGSNCGILTLLNGELVSADLAPCWKDQSDDEKEKWRRFAFYLCNPDGDISELDSDEEEAG